MFDYTINTVKYLTGNRILNTAIVACVSAQLLKPFIGLLLTKRFRLSLMFGMGGMPSSHSALAVALATSVGQVCRVQSPEFAITACFALVVMFDASGVRRAAGQQARIINYMMEHWKEATPELFGEKLKELLGHTPFEVIIGALLGLIVAFLPM